MKRCTIKLQSGIEHVHSSVEILYWGGGPALAGPILILSLKYTSFLNPKEVAVYVQCITT